MKTIRRQLEVRGFELWDQQYSPGAVIGAHVHRVAEFCFMLRGSLTERIGKAAVEYNGFEVGFKPAGVDHRVEVSSHGARCLVLAIPATCMSRISAHVPELSRFGQLAGMAVGPIRASVLREFAACDDVTPLVLEGLALELAVQTGRPPSRRESIRAPAWLHRVRERLDDDQHRPTMDEIGSLVGVRPPTVALAFRRFYGCSVGGYLRQRRVSRARSLLASGERSLCRIAAECGFYDQSHFTKVFHRAVGMTPRQYLLSVGAAPPPGEELRTEP